MNIVTTNSSRTRTPGRPSEHPSMITAFELAETHVLGERKGGWLAKGCLRHVDRSEVDSARRSMVLP